MLLGMDEVRLHSFVGNCGSDLLESTFPASGKQYITFEQLKEVMVFEGMEGHEQTITFWHNYLFLLSKYEAGMVQHIQLLQT